MKAPAWIARVVRWLTLPRETSQRGGGGRASAPDEKSLERWADDGGSAGATRDRRD
jgi:hypothetical protein